MGLKFLCKSFVRSKQIFLVDFSTYRAKHSVWPKLDSFYIIHLSNSIFLLFLSFQILVGRVYPMNLELLQSLLNTTYTYFTLLRNVYDWKWFLKSHAVYGHLLQGFWYYVKILQEIMFRQKMKIFNIISTDIVCVNKRRKSFLVFT